MLLLNKEFISKKKKITEYIYTKKIILKEQYF